MTDKELNQVAEQLANDPEFREMVQKRLKLESSSRSWSRFTIVLGIVNLLIAAGSGMNGEFGFVFWICLFAGLFAIALHWENSKAIHMTANKRAKIQSRIRRLEIDLKVLHDELSSAGLRECAELVGQTHAALQEVKEQLESSSGKEGNGAHFRREKL